MMHGRKNISTAALQLDTTTHEHVLVPRHVSAIFGDPQGGTEQREIIIASYGKHVQK
jgi:hypothetical protein